MSVAPEQVPPDPSSASGAKVQPVPPAEEKDPKKAAAVGGDVNGPNADKKDASAGLNEQKNASQESEKKGASGEDERRQGGGEDGANGAPPPPAGNPGFNGVAMQGKYNEVSKSFSLFASDAAQNKTSDVPGFRTVYWHTKIA